MRILIVDDERDFRELLSIALQGHDIFIAKNGTEAVTLAECNQPDVVLMDVLMPPGMYGGFKALKRLKANKSTAHIPVLLMSACAQEGDSKRALALGAAAFMPKPFSVFGLAKRLEGYVTEAKRKPGSGPGSRNPDLEKGASNETDCNTSKGKSQVRP